MSQPVNNIEAERAVLGAIIKDPEAIGIVIAIFSSPEYFYEPKHRGIFSAILSLNEIGEPCDITTVSNELYKRKPTKQGYDNRLVEIGGRVYIVDLVEEVASIANLKHHVKIVAEKYEYRKIVDIAESHIKSAVSQEKSPLEISSEMSQQLLPIGRKLDDRRFRKMSHMMPNLVQRIDDVSNNKGDMGIPFGLIDLDSMLGGGHAGDLIVIGGRPSMGKTALMNCLAAIQCENGKKVAIISAETTEEEYSMRTLCTEARIDSRLLKMGKVADWDVIRDTAEQIASWDYFVLDTPAIDINSLVSHVTELKKEEDIDIVYIDYIQILTAKGDFYNEVDMFNCIVRKLKILGKTLNIPVVALSQLNRNVENRHDKRPNLSDFKGTGNIEQDADKVVGLYRPELYVGKKKKDEGKHRNLAIAIVLKHRNGPIGDVHLYFNPIFTRFENIRAEQPDLPGMPF